MTHQQFLNLKKGDILVPSKLFLSCKTSIELNNKIKECLPKHVNDFQGVNFIAKLNKNSKIKVISEHFASGNNVLHIKVEYNSFLTISERTFPCFDVCIKEKIQKILKI